MKAEDKLESMLNKKFDKENRQFIIYMCKKCKFYKNKCTKGRMIRECASKGLKNK